MSDDIKKIKPIQTEYNGLKFRSRLEARWAVFFDTAKIKYEYEPEGYEDENGNRYLPDFYLPDYDIYVEVKRDTEEGLNEIINKCEPAIVWGGEIKQILILSTIPGECTDGGEWAFPIMRWEGTQVVWRWLCFWEGHTHKEVFADVVEKCGYSFDVIVREKSIKPFTTKRLNWAKSDSETIRKIGYLLGYRDRCEVKLTVEEEIDEINEMRSLTYHAFEQARKARFEF